MSAETENLVLGNLRYIRARVDQLADDMADVKQGLSSLEMKVSQIHGDFAGQSARIDRLENRLDVIPTSA
jgi:predicted  nucleic acid-binding Zn-ribbon protein